MLAWIGRGLVLAIHDRQLAEHGGSSGIRDETLLDSALARPRQVLAYADPPADLADLAASPAHGVARNHPFVDGNKRTAAVICETFLRLNGAVLDAGDVELFPVYLAVAEGKLSEQDFAAWLRARLKFRAPGAVQEPRASYRQVATRQGR